MSFVPTTAMRVLFLDIDGVLVRDGTRHFDEEALAQLHRVLARTGAVIVLHSVWKGFRGKVMQINATFKQHGMKEISARTKAAPSKDRVEEITTWLREFATALPSPSSLEKDQVMANISISAPSHLEAISSVAGKPPLHLPKSSPYFHFLAAPSEDDEMVALKKECGEQAAVEAYAIIDDEDLTTSPSATEDFLAHVVRTETARGLTADNAEKLIEILLK